MKAQTIIFAGAAAAIVGIAFVAARRTGAIAPASSGVSDDTQRLAGVQAIYNMSAGQSNAVAQAVAANWKSLEDSVFKSQPDFWV